MNRCGSISEPDGSYLKGQHSIRVTVPTLITRKVPSHRPPSPTPAVFSAGPAHCCSEKDIKIGFAVGTKAWSRPREKEGARVRSWVLFSGWSVAFKCAVHGDLWATLWTGTLCHGVQDSEKLCWHLTAVVTMSSDAVVSSDEPYVCTAGGCRSAENSVPTFPAAFQHPRDAYSWWSHTA